MREVKVPLKSKLPELLLRMATALHAFEHAMTQLLAGVLATFPPTQIEKATPERATDFVNHLESQRSILCHISDKCIYCAILF